MGHRGHIGKTFVRVAVAALALSCLRTVQAAQKTWAGIGAGGTTLQNTLNTSGNWTGGAPGTTDDALLNLNFGGGTASANIIDSSAFSVQNLSISNGVPRSSAAGGSFNDTVTFSFALTLSSNLVVAAFGGTKNYTLDVNMSAAATMLNATFNGATKSGSSGIATTTTLTFGGATTIKSNLTFNGNTGLSTLELNGATTIGSNLVFVGGAGTNVLTIANATTVSNNFSFGANSGAVASNWVNVTGNLKVLGTLSVTNGNSRNGITIGNDSTISSLSVTGNLTDTYFNIVNADLTVSNGLSNLGKIDVTSGGVLRVVPAFTNASIINLNTGTIAGGALTNLASGTITGSGAVSNLLVNSGIVVATNGELRLAGVVSGAGSYRAVAGTSASTLTFAGGGSISSLFNTGATIQVVGLLTNANSFANRGTLTIAGGTYQSVNNVTNAAGFVVNGNGTLDSGLVNNGGTVTVTGGSLTFTRAPVQTGNIDVNNAATLNILQAWQNSGTVTLLGGTVVGSAITNSSTLTGNGAVVAPVINSGMVNATNGELQLAGVASGAGTFRAVAGTSAATLTFAGGGSISALFNTGATIRVVSSSLTNANSFANRGTISLAGGTYQSAKDLTNATGFQVGNESGNSGTIDARLINTGTLAANSGTLTLTTAPVQSGAVNIAAGGDLNVLQDWANSGTITFTAGGAITGGNLTNTSASAGAIAGAGFINSFLINQNRLDLNGLTVSNNFLQTAGSFTVSGSSTITGLATINGGTNNLSGNRLTTGLLVIGPNGVLTNGTTGATLNGGVTNSGTVNVTANTYFNGTVTNTGAFFFQGAISNNLVNSANGTVTLNNTATITQTANINGGTFNLNGQTYSNGLMVVGGTAVLTNGVANATFSGGLSNAGTVALTANTFFNGSVTNTGAFFWQGAISNNYVQTAGTNFLNGNATITQNATVSGGLFNLNGKTYSNGLMVVSGSGVLTSSLANATFNGGLSNAATVYLSQGVTFNGPVTNMAAFSWLGTINNMYSQGAGTNQLLGNATITGNVSVNGGLMDLNGNNEAFGALVGTGGTVLNNGITAGTLTIGANNNSGTYSGVITNGNGAITLVKTGTGTETLSGVNGYSGATVVTGGTLKDGVANALPTGTTLTVSNATFDLGGNAQSIAGLSDGGVATGVVTNSGASAAFTINNSANTTYSGKIAGALALTKTNSGVLTLTGSNSYSGGTVINGGVLVAATLPSTGSTSSGIGTGSLTLSGGTLRYNGASFTSSGFATTVGANGGTLDNAASPIAGPIFYGGTVSGSGTLNIMDSTGNGNQWLFTNASSGFTGSINIGNGSAGSGWLQVRGVTSANQVGTGTVTVNGGGTFSYDTGSPATIANPIILNGGALGAQNVAVTYSGPIAISNNSFIGGVQAAGGTTMTLSGVISGPGGFTTAGNNGTTTIVLGNANTFSGGVTLNSGTLQLNNALAIQNSTVNDLTNNALIFGAPTSYTVGGLAGTGNVALTNGAGGVAFSVGNNNSSTAYSGVLSGSGSLTKIGSGVLTLSGANTYSGATTISTGTLKLGANNVIPGGASAGNVTDNSTLDMAGFSDTINGLSGSGTVDNSTGSGNTLTVGGNNANSTFSGVIQNASGSLALIKTGTGTLALSGSSANTYNGLTTVNAGELDLNKGAGVNAIGGSLTVAGGEVKLLANEQLANGAVVTINSGSFNLNGAAETVGNMIIGPSGLLTNGISGGTLNGGITNSGTIFASQATYFNGAVTNMGSIFFSGAISNNLVNRSSFTLNGDSTLTAAPINTGTMDANGNTLTVTPDWANSGTILLGGGSLAGGNLTNNGMVAEFGIVSNQLINAGVVAATNGELRLVGAASGAGTYRAVAGASASTLTFAGGGSISGLFNTNATIRLENVLTNNSLFVNQGTLALAGGAYQSTASLTNAAGKVVIGSGTISVQGFVNASTAIIEATNGTLTFLQAPAMQGIVNVRSDGTLRFGSTGSPLVVTNATTGSIRMYGGTIGFSALTNIGDIAAYNGGGTLTGVVINASSGSIDATNGTLVFLNDLVNGGLVTNSAGIQIGAAGTGAITNSGTYVFAGGALNANVITNTGTALGSGVDNANMVNSGVVTATNGELRLLGTASGAGTYRTVAGTSAATLTFGGGGSISTLLNTGSTIRVENSVLTNTASFVNRGTLTLAGGTYQSSASVNNTGAFQIENAAGTVGTLNAALVNAGTLAANSGTLTLLVAPTQNGAVNIAAGGVLNVVPDWANNGTINFTAGGAISGGTLTNISASGTIAGAGFINSFLVNQNRLDINGLTVSNNFLQTAGSFTVSGSSTITGLATLNGGTLNLQGKNLAVDSVILAPGAVLTNAVLGATLNGDITNAGTVNVTADLYVLGAVTNTGTWIQRGVISNTVVNAGTMTLVTNTINPRITGGVVNSGSLAFNGTGFVNGAVTNSGSISFNGAISNNYVQTGGSITLAAAGTITGTANINAGTFNLNGQTYSNGLMVVSGGGVLTNSGTGASFSGGLSNDATVAVTADTFFKGPITNTGSFFFRGAISNSFVNSDTFVLNNNATLTVAPVNTGTMDVSSPGNTLTVTPAWSNSGTVLLGGGTLAGGNLTNNATVMEFGTISAALINAGSLIATNGTLTLTVAPQQRGVVNVAGGATPGTLTVTPAWTNNGTVSIAAGGAILGGNVTNLASGTVTNFGAINTLLVNQGRSVLGGLVSNFQQASGTNTVSGSGSVTGTATISGGLFDLNGSTYSNGLMIVSGTGVLTNAIVGGTFNGGLSNAATVGVTGSTFFNGQVTNAGSFFWEGAISNNFVQTAGTTRLNDDSTITGVASITGGSFDLNGNNYSNRLMVLSGTGILTNAIAGATFNGGLSNAATVAVTADTFFNGPVTNTGSFFLRGAVSNNLINSANATLTINNSATITGLLANFAGNQVNVGNGTLQLLSAPTQSGTLTIGASGALNIPTAWANGGSVLINGGTVASGNLTNNSGAALAGFGTISNAVINVAGALITVSNGTLVVGALVQNGGVNVTANGTLNATPDWSSSGTINVASGGAISGGNLTNTSTTGTLSGSGVINSFVINQGRMNWGGTINNNFLQTAGSFTVSGSATITGAASINGGTLDLNGNRLTDSSLIIGASGTLTNAIAGATLNGGITNAGTVNVTADLYLLGAVTNTGTWIQRGAISNTVVNAGTMTLVTNTINPRITGGVVNSGSLAFNGTGFVNGAVTNSGSISFNGAISNNYVQTGGSITLAGTGTITGTASITAGTFDLNGKTYSNNVMVVSGSGVLTSSVANASFNGGLSNAGTVSIPLNATFNGPVTNMATFAWQGTINNSYAQGGGTNLFNGNSTITGNTAISDGLVNFNGKNGTFGSLNGGGGTLLNNGNGASVLTVNNGGSFSGTIADQTVGTGTMALTVGGGVLTLGGNNTYSGVTTINSGGTLKMGGANALGSTAGNTVVSSGGVLDLNGQVIDGEPLTLNGTGISNGGALINSSGTGASLGGAITLGSASSIGGSGDMTLSGAIGGGNNLTKVGADTVTLTAANGYTGATIISNGVLNIQNNTALGTTAGGVTVTSGTALQLQGGITVGAKALSLNGTGISNDGALRNISGSNTYGGAITLAGASRINSDAGTLTLGGGITGGGSALTIGGAGNVLVNSAIGGTSTTLTKDGTGTLNLTGNNNYTGATVVNGGTLKVNNASGSGISGGSVTISNGGTLGGSGTITVGVTVNTGGHIAPGNSVGTFNVATLTLTSGSVLDFEFNSTPANDLINVLNSGGLTLNGGGFDLYQEGTTTAWSTAGTYNLISYSGALAGSIGNLSVLNPAADKVYTFGNTGSMITLQIAGGQSWTGLGSDNFWSSGANWSTATPSAGDLLVFDGTTRINNTNNLTANTQFVGITYDVSAGAFTNSGNAVNLTGDIVNNSTNTQTIKLPLVFDGNNRTINAASGALVVSGPISDTNGTWGLIKSGAGTLTLSGNTANTYSGLTTVNAGELDLNKTAGQNAVGGDLSVNNGATVRLLASGQIGDTANVTVNNGGQFNLNGFAETIGGMANAGTIVVGGGALTVSQTLQNSGTVTLTAGGAVAGGVLSNLTSGLVSGSGFIKSLMVNQGAMNFGGTISNNFLQTGGSFTVSGSATITGAGSINGGTLDLVGHQLTDGSLIIGAGGTLTNAIAGATLNSGITNAGTVNVTADLYVLGAVTNTGTWMERGAISNSVVNAGTMTLSTNSFNPRVTGGIVNSGSLVFAGAGFVSGAVTNSGSISFNGAISNNYVQTGGSITLAGTGTITGTASITAGTFNLNGQTYSDSLMVLSGGGVLTNSVANASISGGLSNDATVAVTANTFFKGPVTNTGNFYFQGAISNTFVSSDTAKLLGAGTITGTASITGGTFDLNGKSLALSQMFIASAGVLTNSTAGASIAGAVTLQNSTLSGQLVTNNATVSGSGTISAAFNNMAGGVISANAGLLTITGALTQNGTINVAAGSTLNVPQAFSNSGSLLLQGGFVQGGTITVTAGDNISGFGTISNEIVNAGLITATGGTLTLAAGAPTTQSGSGINIASGGTLSINEAWANSGTMAVNGTLIGGAVTNTSNTGTLSGSGTIRTFVVNQGRMDFGGTITSNLLQNSGSFTLSGNATITGNATISAGGLQLVNNLLTVGLLTIGNGATMQNSGNPGTITGSVVNNGTVNFNLNDLFDDSSVVINGQVLNNGTWTEAGVINGQLVNTGSFNWTSHSYFFGLAQETSPILNGGITNTGILTFDPSYVATVNGSVTNSGAININGKVTGNLWQTGGTFTLNGAGTISGPANIAGGVFNLNGQTYNGSTMVVSSSGVLTNAGANESFNSGLSNAANVGVTANTFFKGAVTNTGTFAFMGAVSNTLVNSGDVVLNGSATISGALLNSGSVNVNSGTLSLVVAPTQTGSITVRNGATLNAAQAWVNNGTITMLGGVVTNATLTNAQFINGFGSINGAGVVNNGEILADASSISGTGTLTVRLTSFTNNSTATLGTASSNAVLNLLQAGNGLINQGTISLSGGTILLNGGGGTITNFNIIAGVGNVANFPIVNVGTLASFVAQAPILNLSNLVATVGITNSGLLGANNFINGAATLSLTVNGGGAAIVNQGTVALQGGFLTVNGGAGVITNFNNGLIYGFGLQNLSVANLASGKILASNGVFSLGLQNNANAGLLSNANAASTILLTNKFLVNTGTIVLNGGGLLLSGSVITNESSITGPGALSSSLYNDAAGVVLVTNGVLNVATNAGESVLNLGLFTITSDGTLNVVPSWLNTNGTVSISGGGITGGAVTNVGLLTGFGTITSQLVNLGGGTVTASGAGSLTLVAAPTQNGWVNIANAGTLNVLQAWLNSGLVNLQGGSLVGSTITNAGAIFGSGTITPTVRNTAGGTLTANGGTLTLSVAPNQLGSVVISNAATLNVLQAWQNSGTLSLFGGTAIGSTITDSSMISGFGTITPQVQNNGGATLTATGGTLTLAIAPNQLGTFVVANGGTLNVQQAWQNGGLLSMAGGTEIGSTITNAANINGFGTITPLVVNNAGATLTANSGLLTLALALMQNGTVAATNGGTLNVQQAWQNNGVVNFLGGDITGSTVTNAGTMTGFGGVQSLVNNVGLYVTNGTLHVTTSFTQNGGVNVAANSRLDVTPTWLNNGSVVIGGGFTSGGTMTNTAAALLRGFGTISNALVNLGSMVVTNGTLNLISAPTQSGTITIANAATLNSVQAWQNGGSLSIQGGSVGGGSVTNTGAISGFGTFSPSVINNSGATITASSGGTLTLTAIPLQNGLVNILGTLNVASAWSNGNAGTVSMNGGVLTGGTFTVDGTVKGNGTIAANMMISNAKTVIVNGGQMNLTAQTTMDGGVINGGPVINHGTISGDGTLSVALSNPGYVRATNGLLYIQALTGNQATGTLEASTGGTLQANGITPWLNNGQVILSGGTVIGGNISNTSTKVISGYGTINSSVYNSGQILANNAGQTLAFGNTLMNLNGGVVSVNAGSLTVSGAFTNNGTLSMVQSFGTFGGPVVNSGAWVTDPTTNVFLNTYTVTSSGYIQSSAGDVYIFSNSATTAANFINVSTNKAQYNTLSGGDFVFANTLGLTQVFATAGRDFGPPAATATNLIQVLDPNPFSLPEYSNNFALGTLQISSFTTVRVDDAFITGGAGTDDNLTAALYLNNLFMGTDSLLLISSNVQVYFITSNNWSLANVQLLGNPTYDPTINGIHQLVVVPEPAIVLLWLSSIATVYAAKRRNARSPKSK